MFIVHAKHIAEFAVTQRLPTIGFREFVEAGGLAAYAVDLDDMWRRSMALVDKIFRGAKPGDLPIRNKIQMTRNASIPLGRCPSLRPSFRRRPALLYSNPAQTALR